MKAESAEVLVTFFVKDSIGSPEELDHIERFPSVQLAASLETRIHDLAGDAFAALELAPPDSSSLLFVCHARADGSRAVAPYLSVAVDERKRLYWRIGAGSSDTTVGDVIRANEEGLFEGDPLAFAVDRGGYGDGGLVVTWAGLMELLKDIGGIAGGAIALQKLAKWLHAFIERHLPKWLRRNAKNPSAFFDAVIGRQTWDVVQLARLLEIERDEAANLLVALGYELVEGNTYTWSSEESKMELRKALQNQGFMWVREEFEEDEDSD